MKSTLLSFLSLSLLLVLRTVAQTTMNEVPLDKRFTNATVLTFKPPYLTMGVYLEDDLDARYSTSSMNNSTLFLKKFRKPDKVKLDDKVQPSAIVPGMKVDLYIDHYQRSLKNIAKEIVLSDDYYGSVNLTGLFEFFEGQKAAVDGQLVILDKGAIIKGQNEWKDKKFNSFSELQLGCELTLHGQRETDGIIYVSRGTARPVEENNDDLMMRRAVDLGMKVDKNRLSIGKTFTKTFITDNTLQDYVNSLGRKLVPQYIRSLPIDHPDHIDFKFYLVNDESMNASAFPNGTVVIHTGLLKNISNEAQLASVLGHEIAHVTQKHQAKNYRNRKSWKTITDVLSVATTVGGAASSPQNRRANQMSRTSTNQRGQSSIITTGNLPVGFLTILSEMYVSEYSRSQEMQADRIGLRYMYDAGFDPREAANIWKKLSQDETDAKRDVAATNMMMQMMDEPTKVRETSGKPISPEKRESIYASHPKSRDRFNHVSFLLSTAYANADFSTKIVDAEQHQRMLSLLKTYKASAGAPGHPASDKPNRTRPSTAKGPKP